MSNTSDSANLQVRLTELEARVVQREAELAIINSIQASVVSKLDIQKIYELVGDKIRDVFDAQVLLIITFDHGTGQSAVPYGIEKSERIYLAAGPYTALEQHLIRTRQLFLCNEKWAERSLEIIGELNVPIGEAPKSVLAAPLIIGELVTGAISLQNIDHENAFSDSDVRLLTTLANSLSVALENARLLDETQRLLKETEERNAELAVITSVQQGLASKLEFQSIIDLVGDKVNEIFNAQATLISLFNPVTDEIAHRYLIERGVRFHLGGPVPIDKFRQRVVQTHRPWLINRDYLQVAAEIGEATVLEGEEPKSLLFVPMIVGTEVTGIISLQNLDSENAFSESDVRLLSTIAASMSVALENAHLNEKSQNELLQQIHAKEKEERRRAILEKVITTGQNVAEVHDLRTTLIRIWHGVHDDLGFDRVGLYLYNPKRNSMDGTFGTDNQGQLLDEWHTWVSLDQDKQESKSFLQVLEKPDSVLVTHTYETDNNIPAGHIMTGVKDFAAVAAWAGGKPVAVICVDHQITGRPIVAEQLEAIRLFAGYAGLAIENARLFDETQRLLKETEDRAAELAVINSIQQGLAAELNFQAIIDLVGDKLRDVLRTGEIGIRWYEPGTNLIHYLYEFEHGQRIQVPSQSPQGKIWEELVNTRKPIILNTQAEFAAFGTVAIPGTDVSQSCVYVPIIGSDRVLGTIITENYEKESAYSDTDIRLLTTVASSMGVALENARLYQEIQRRAQEMTTLAEIGSDIAASRDLVPVLTRIASHAKDLLRVRDIAIYLREPDGQTFRAPVALGKYIDEIKDSPVQSGQGISGNIAKTGLAEMVNYPMRDPRVYHIPGTGEGEEEEQEGLMAAPLISRGQTIGLMTVWRPHADGLFVQAELEFLISVARQAAIAIESARLYLETQRRANEMAALAEVGREISATLELSVVLERIATRALDLLAADTSAVYLPEANSQTLHAIAAVGDIADEIRADHIRIGEGIIGDLALRRAAEFINDTNRDARALVIPGTSQHIQDERLMVAPLLAGDRLSGMMAVWRTGGIPFAETDLNFLIGLARQAAIAIENARLFNETTQRAAELSTINSLGQALASQLEPKAVIDLAGDKLCELFGMQYIYIALHDAVDNLIHFPYFWQTDHRELADEAMPYGGLTARIIETRQPQLINNNWVEQATALGAAAMHGEMPKASLGVPILVGESAIGVIMLQSTERENRFSEADVRLLTTIAANVGVAIQNARLYEESQRRTRQSVALNDLGREISTSLDLKIVLERIAARALELLRARDVVIRLLEPDGGLPASVALGKYSEIYKARNLHLGQGLTGHIAQSGQAEIVNRPLTDLRVTHVAGTEADEDREAMLFAPLLLGVTVIGILVVWRDKVEHGLFEQPDLEFAIGLARQAAIAIQNARLFTESENQRQYFESLVQFSPAAIATTHLNGQISSWNPAAEKLFGYTAEEAIGRTLDELIGNSEETLGENVPVVDVSLVSNRARAITRRNRKDGSLVDVEQMAVAVKVDGVPRGILAIYHDVTELQHARREAELANVSKSAFLATMSHEIRTPMNGIIGMTGLLLGTELSEEQREFTEVIRTSGESLLSIINDILDFSKIESGKMDLESQPFDLRDCVESALDLVATVANNKNLDLAYVIEDDVPPVIVGDVTRLRQILLNLLSNAVKFTEKGEVVVTVALLPLPKSKTTADVTPKQQLHITVRDTGIGIPIDRLDRLFQSFSQLDSSTARKYGGTGLGLAISKRLCELMDGSMWVVSSGIPGGGSTFHFTLVAATAPSIKSRSYLAGDQPQLIGKYLLIVDDNPTNRRILTLQTQKWGMATRVAASGKQALDWIMKGEHFSAAILDMHMPEMDGVTLARALRQVEAGKALPLILFSSLGRREVGAEAGLFSAYLSKPLKQSQLFDTLLGIFSGSELKFQTVPMRSTPANSLTDSEMGKHWPLRILLAEDNVVNQMLAQRMLNQIGYRADVVANGNEVLEAVARQQYDLILMDVQMPDMDGLEATRQIVARWPIEHRPRIVAMTANAMQGDREMCIAAGMNDYISKPIRVEELIKALRQSQPIAKA